VFPKLQTNWPLVATEALASVLPVTTARVSESSARIVLLAVAPIMKLPEIVRVAVESPERTKVETPWAALPDAQLSVIEICSAAVEPVGISKAVEPSV
jgi:hypothetical protein